MKTRHRKQMGYGFWILAVFIFLWGCEKYEKQPGIWNPEEKGAPAPVIESVDPTVGFAGVSKIKIQGKNFPTDTSKIWVYFNSQLAEILSLSETLIVVKAPDMVADSITIRVVSRDAFVIAEYTGFKLEPVSVEYGGFTNLDQVWTIAIDADDNMYAMLKVYKVYKIFPDGTRDETFGKAPFAKASEIRVGPGGYLYLQRSNNKGLYRMSLSGGDAELYKTLPDRASYFDFDQYGNIYSGGKYGLMVTPADGSPSWKVTDYNGKDIRSVRVFQNAVYVSVAGTGAGIWKSEILDQKGNLGPPVQYFDWADAGEFAAHDPGSITFSEDGDLYVGTSNPDPILVIHPDGSTEPLYPGILKPTAGQLVWGNGDYLFVNRTSRDPQLRRVIRVAMGKKGAPYYGRQL